jgi:ABC-type xylose transport system permease subunit
MSAVGGAAVPAVDERVTRVNPLRRAFTRPEMGAVAGAVAVWVFFAIVAGGNGFLTLRGTASYLEVAAELGILAVPVALLMIGGEFDLSIGSVIGAGSMTTALLAAQFGWNIWPALFVSLAVALALGAFNGTLVLRTGLPSFIVTLGTLFMVRARPSRSPGSRPAAPRSATSTRSAATTLRGRFSRRASRSGRRRCRSRSSGGWRWSVSARGCCCGRGSATGSSASAATRRRRATSASRSAPSRSSCSC